MKLHDEQSILEQKVLQILSDKYYNIHLRKERDSINIYTHKYNEKSFVFQFKIPQELVNKDFYKRLKRAAFIINRRNKKPTLFSNLFYIMNPNEVKKYNY